MSKPDHLRTLPELFKRLHSLVVHSQARNAEVSNWSVGDQIEHICLAAGGFAMVLITGRGPSFEGVHREQKDSVLVNGSIPRGVIQAPAAGQPKTDLSTEELYLILRKTMSRLERAASVPDDRSADHPLLGPLTRDEVLRFTEVHTQHHLAIIDDILSSQAC